jgi:hypothetical protein
LDAGRGLTEIVSRYTQTFLWLQAYDEGLLEEPTGEAGGAPLRLLPSKKGWFLTTKYNKCAALLSIVGFVLLDL